MCLRVPPFPTSTVLKSAAMVMAIFLKWSPFRCNGGEVKVVLGRGGCEDYIELLRVHVALQFHVFLCVYVYVSPPFPTSAVLKSAVMVMAIFLKWGPFRCNGGEVKVILGREGCEDYAELPHVRVALQFRICFYVYVYVSPPFPTTAVLKSCGAGDGHFLKWSPFRYNGG